MWKNGSFIDFVDRKGKFLFRRSETKAKLESTIETYKIKLEEMSELRQQIKFLEESNLRLFDEKSNIEQECKQAKLLQTQVEFQKKTNQELYQKISELQRLADKADFERNRAEERYNAVNAEKIVRKIDIRSFVFVCRQTEVFHFHDAKFLSERSRRISMQHDFS